MSKCFVLLVSILSIVLGPTLLWADTAAAADFDGSGKVDFGDFLQLAGAFGTSQARYDLNGSGTVDFPDFLAFVSVYGQSVSPNIVTFQDSNLEAVVRDSISKPEGDILLSDISELTALKTTPNLIASLDGIENLISLTYLHLYGNQISDLSPLSNLTALTGLGLNENQISDLSPLVANRGLGPGDTIHLRNNPLSADALTTQIPALEARGVWVGIIP